MSKSCRNCIYHRHPRNIYDAACHYLYETGKIRPCPVNNCTVRLTAKQAQKLKTKGMIINQDFEEAFKNEQINQHKS